MQSIRSIFDRIKRLHPFTWVVAGVVLAVLVLIMVPGEESPKQEEPSTAWQRECNKAREQTAALDPEGMTYVRLYEHGWPRPWLARTVAEGDLLDAIFAMVNKSKNQTVSWTSKWNWPLEGEEWRVRWWALALDITIFAGLLALVTWASERWLRRRGGHLRLRIVDLLVATTICGAVIGWYTANSRQRLLELKLSEQFDTKSSTSRFDDDAWRYTGPVWLRKLVGNPDRLSAFWRRTDVDITMTADRKRDMGELSKMSSIESVSIHGALTWDALRQLEELPRLKKLRLYSFRDHSVVAAKRAQFDPTSDLVLADDLEELARLRISELELNGETITVDQLTRLLSVMPQLQEL